MNRYSRDQIEIFLCAIDKHLTDQFTLIIIGGTAAALGYAIEYYTRDIDTMNSVSSIADAYEAAKRETGLDIPMERVTVGEAPYHYQDRLEEVGINGLTRLSVKVPEKHDLAFMKAVMRGYRHDMEAIADIHKLQPFDFETFVARMDAEMTHVTGDPRKILENFFAMIEELFGDAVLAESQVRLKGWGKR
jgi:hypothetical protein